MGAFDDLVPGGDAPAPGGTFADLVPKRGPIGEIAAAAKRSLYTGVKGAGEVLQAPAEMAGEEPGMISRFGQRLEAYGKQGEAQVPLEPDKHSGTTNFLAHAAAATGEALPLLATTIPAAVVGAGAGTLVAPGPGTVAGAVGGAIGSGLAGGTTAALQAYHEKYHEALEKGLPDDQARAYAKASAAVQGTLMGAVSAVPMAGPLARTVLRPGAETAERALADMTGKRFLPEFGKSAAELAAVNTGLGAAGAAGQAVIDEKTGLPTVSPGEAALQSIPGSLAASVGFLPLAVHPAISAARASKEIRSPLENAEAPVSDRLKAALIVHQGIDRIDPDAARAWDANATEAIHAGQPVPLDDSVFNGGGTVPEGDAAPGEHIPSAVDDEAPRSNVDPSLGPLSRAAAQAEHATLPGFPFSSPDAAEKSLEGRGAPPEGWQFQVQRHPSIENRWAVTLRQLSKEEQDARAVEDEAGPAGRADAPGAEGADREGAPAAADVSRELGGGSGEGEEAPHLDALAHEAATSPLNERPEPTDAQKEAGNYALGHLKVHGMDISVENPAGSVRSGVNSDGTPWEQVMQDHYGYIRGTVGRDKDHIDTFVGPNPESTRAFVVDQVDPTTGKFDEHKVVLGASSIKEARDIYQRNYEPGWKGLGDIRPTTIEKLKRWFKEGDLNKPFSDAEADDYATGKGQEQGRDLGQHQGARAGVPGEGADREQPAGQQGQGAKAGGGDRSEHSEALQAVAAAAQAVRAGDPKSVGDAIKRLDAARLRARNMGAPEEEVRAAAAGPGSALRFIDHRNGDFVAMRGEREVARAKVNDDDHLEGLTVAKGEREAEAFLRGNIERALGRPLRTEPTPKAEPEPEAQHEDFTTRKGEVKSFDTEKKALAYQANRTNRVPSNFKPRQTEDGWVLSRPQRERSPAQRANDQRLARARSTFDAERDPLATFMGKMGGISAADLLKDGVDPKDLKDLRSGVVGKPAYRTKGGISLDAMAELAASHGFDVLDEAGRPDATKMRELIEEELSGNHIYTPEGYERLASLEAEQREREDRARFENDFDEGELRRSGYDDLSEDAQALVERIFQEEENARVAATWNSSRESLSDAEADRLFVDWSHAPRGPEEATAGGEGEGPHGGEAPPRDESVPAPEGRQELELKGETDGEIRTREAREAKAAEEQRKQASAPAPEGFVLTGSDRAVDEARARGQDELFHAAERLEPVKAEAAVESIPAGVGAQTEAHAARVTDFGEKIGGARKDVAKPLGPRGTMSRVQDERPGWARKYVAMRTEPGSRYTRPEHVGKWQLMKESGARGSVQPVDRRRYFDTEAEALATIPLAEAARNHRVMPYSSEAGTRWGIYRIIGDRKRALVKGDFASEEAAMRAMAEDPVSVIEHKFPFPERPWLDKILRVGPTDRTGDVTPEMFQKTFGFRGGEFGNWNMGGDGQAALNHAYDGLLDLAHTVGVPPKALSLNGDLAIAFGARGHGGKDSAAAHYERDKRVINLTKINGAGSLAHEWFHALDHYLGQVAGKTDTTVEPSTSYLTYGPHWKNTARPELLKAFDNVVRTMTSKTEGRAIEEEGAKRGLQRSQETLKSRLDQLRSSIAKARDYGAKKAAATPEQLKTWDALAERALGGDNGEAVHVPGQGRMSLGYSSSEVVRGLNDIFKQVTGRSFDRADPGSEGRQLYWNIGSLADMNARVAKAQEGAIEQRHRATDYLAEAKRIDGYRASDYWSTPHEMGARAFESYIFDKLAGEERPSQYLVHAVENKYYALLGMKPYPEGAERESINRAFDDLFKAIQTKETDKGTALFSRAASEEKKPVFYSELGRRLDALPQNAGSPQQWKGLIDNLATKGVKREEIEWSGVKDWLDMQQGKVTKEQLQAFLRDNGVKVQETMLGNGAEEQGINARIGDLTVKLDAAGYTVNVDMDGEPESITRRAGSRPMHEEMYFPERSNDISKDGVEDIPDPRVARLAEELFALVPQARTADTQSGTRYSQYTLPGGKNYRELLLTLPEKPAPRETPDASGQVPFREQPEARFRSSHFDQPNILAHVRFDERTDAAGKKVLFIEEIQSDWAQKGKREGFADSLPERVRELSGRRDDMIARGDTNDVWRINAELARLGHAPTTVGSVGAPRAPFVGKTEAWVALAVKRMIRYAAENGFDRVAWTNGEQQAARYDLSKHVRGISWEESREGWRGVHVEVKNGNPLQFRVQQDGTVTGYGGGDATGEIGGGKKLADIVGKDIADKIMAEQKGYLAGDGLKIGGEGMKGFYDRIVPNVVNDVLKKLGGDRVQPVTLNADFRPDHQRNEEVNLYRDKLLAKYGNGIMHKASADELAHLRALDEGRAEQPGFDITPAMRERALEGLPLFSRGARQEPKGDVDLEGVAKRLGVDAKVVATEDELPEHLRSQIERESAQGDIRGVFDPKTGQVWLVGSNIKSEGEAVFVALHESAHRGLRALFGEDLNPILEHIYQTNESVQARAAELAAEHGYDRLRATEETLADMALRGQARNLKGWDRFVDFIRRWVAKMGFPLKVSDEMAEHIAGAAAQAGKRELLPEAAEEARMSVAPASMVGMAEKLRAGLSDVDKQREVARGGLRAAMGELNRRMSTMDALLDKARKSVDAIPVKERWDAMQEYQTGGVAAVASPKLRPIFAAWKSNVDERAQQIQAWDEGYLKEVLPHYFSQMWKDPAKAVEWYQRMMGKGPLEGAKSFLKKRAYATYKEGMSWKVFDDQGGVRYFSSEREARAISRPNDVVKPPLEPISQNFIDIAQLSLQQMDKFTAMHEYRQWLKEEKGWVKRVRRGEDAPPGFARVDDPAFRTQAVFPIMDKETGKPGAAAVTYDYMVPELIAKDLNNYLSSGLYQYGFWRKFRYAQNLLLSARLGFSAFHAGFTTVDTLVSHTDIGAQYLLQGDVGKALTTWGKAVTSPISAPLEGRKLLKQFFGEASADADTAAVLEFLTQGGARGRMNPTDFNNSWASLKRAWADGKVKDTAFHALPAVMEGVMRPIMHYLVPWQKMTARVLLAKFELDRVAGELGQKPGNYAKIVDAMGQDAMRQIAYKVVQQVDDRLGQVAYDNLFWNKIAKDIAQASIQSVGWNVGTANVILGGAKDVARLVKPEELLGPLDKAGLSKQKTLARTTGRLSYLISLNLTVGMIGAALQYALSGQTPQDLRDYFFPRTGRKNPDGSDERISMPSYIKDEYALTQHPITTVQHKLHPFFSMVAELLKNEDFYGNQIVNPDDPWTTMAKQLVGYLGKSVEPYAVQNLQQNRSKGTTGAMQAAPFIGITPAPSSVSRTPFEAYVAERYASAYHESLSPESAEKAQSRREAINAIKNGQRPDLAPFTPRERMSIFTAARTPVQQQRFNRLSLPAKLSAWDRATPEERAKFHLRQAIARDFVLHGATLDPDVRNKAMDVMRGGQ